MGLDAPFEVARKTMVLFFVIDTSGSMSGDKIGAVNTAIEEVIPALQEVSDENADAVVKLAVLEFSTGARRITKSGPVDAAGFHWNYINAAGGTDLGEACRALDEKLSRKAFMASATGNYAPIIFLLSDGEPTDDFASGLDKLRANNWFKVAGKVAIAIGEDANAEELVKFTGNTETVLRVHDRATLKNMIKVVAVRSSQIASRSSMIDSRGGEKSDGLDMSSVVGGAVSENATQSDSGIMDIPAGDDEAEGW